MECLNYLSITKPATLIFLGIILLSSTNLPSILSQEYEQYIRCRHQFNCGKITRIDYPFWGGDRPEECGYPGLKLDCTNGTTIIQINSVDYRVLDINQSTQVLKTTRNDLFLNLCTQEFKNATLDTGLFEYVSGYINVTFLYGCPNLNFPVPYQFDCPVKGIRERNGYVEFGVQLSGMCHKSVVVPVTVSSQSFVNFLDLKEVVRQGFDVRYKGEISGCQECKNSGGSCGYDVSGKQLSCLCGTRNQSAGGVLKTCTSYSMLPAGGNNSQASTVTAPETGILPSNYYALTIGSLSQIERFFKDLQT